MPRFELAGRKPRGKPKRRFIHVEKDDVNLVGAREEDKEDGGEKDALTAVTQEEKRRRRLFQSVAHLRTPTVATGVSGSSACKVDGWTDGCRDQCSWFKSSDAVLFVFKILVWLFSAKTSINNTHNETQVGLAALSHYQHNRIFRCVRLIVANVTAICAAQATKGRTTNRENICRYRALARGHRNPPEEK